MWRALLKPLLALLILILAGAAVAIGLNQPPILEAPGIVARVTTYLGRSEAITSPHSSFPELRTRAYPRPSASVFKAAVAAAADLGWEQVETDERQFILRAVAYSPMLRLPSQVEVSIGGEAGGPSEIRMRSASAELPLDFGANAARIVRFHQALEQQLPRIVDEPAPAAKPRRRG